MTAGSRGLRVSKSSTTRGRPPVMSLVLVVSRGIFASTSPGCTSSPSATIKWAREGMRYFFLALARGIAHENRGLVLFIARRQRDHQLRKAGDFVHLLFDGDAGLQVLELDGAAGFGEDREGVRIPFDHGLAERDRLAFLDLAGARRRRRGGAPSRGPFRRRRRSSRSGSWRRWSCRGPRRPSSR